MPRLLKEIRVLELSQAIAGPTVSQILADYGAEVIKIERPGSGDIFRDTPGMGPSMFLAVNRGKKSVVIDLKSEKGLALFYKLLEKCDIVVENLSPGSAEKMGITYMKARRRNPRVIYCRVQSFGKGPKENVPAFDPVLQAATGIMSTTGFPPDHYARAGVSMVDMSTGMHGAIATLFMLLERERTGKGGLIEIPLYDSAAYYMSYWVGRFDLTGKDTSPLGSTHIFGSPYNLFKTRDGFVYVAVANDKDWDSLCKALGFDDLLDNPNYASSLLRTKNKEVLEEDFGKRIARLETSFVENELTRWLVPFARLNSVKTLLEDPHFNARGLLENYSHNGRSFRTIVNPALVGGRRLHTRKNPPELGEHTSEVLSKLLKMSKKNIKTLHDEGVVRTLDSV